MWMTWCRVADPPSWEWESSSASGSEARMFKKDGEEVSLSDAGTPPSALFQVGASSETGEGGAHGDPPRRRMDFQLVGVW